MSKALYADWDYPDVELEHALFASAGIELGTAQCKTEDDLIHAAAGCSGILVQYAPVTERVVSALPQLGIVSRIGAGIDNVDIAACERHGICVANSPDYGIGDVVTHALVHAPLSEETRGMIDGPLLSHMRPGSYFVNTARGAMVKIDDLLGALDSGILAGAGLDVLPDEPVGSDNPLLAHPRVILTPHAAFFSVQ